MADIVRTIGEVEYQFKEVNPETQWEYEQELDKNEYKVTLCKFGENWVGTVNIKLHTGAIMQFRQEDVSSHEVLIRRLVDHAVRCQQLLVPQPKQF